jgi:hypothetical protein
MTRNQHNTRQLTPFEVLQYYCSFSCSPPGQKPYPNGPEWFIGPVRQVEADSRFGQRQEENKDNPVLPEPHLERDPNVVSIPVLGCNWSGCESNTMCRQRDGADTVVEVKSDILFRALYRLVSDKDLGN